MENLEKLQKLEKENKRLESEINKLSTFSVNDISNFNSIIVNSLEMLSDINKSIEVLAPVSSSSYNSSKLSISSDKFGELLKHKKFLGDKYVKNNLFSERKESLEQTKEKLKLMQKSARISDKNKPNVMRPPSGRKFSASSKKSLSLTESRGNMSELERINILNEEKLERKDEELQQKDVVIGNLRKEIDNNRKEILKLNSLVRLLIFNYLIYRFLNTLLKS